MYILFLYKGDMFILYLQIAAGLYGFFLIRQGSMFMHEIIHVRSN